MKKITKRYRKDIKLLVARLDKHGDPFRSMSLEIETKPELVSKVSRPTPKAQLSAKQAEKLNASGGKKPGPKRKSKADKVIFFP